MAGGNLSPRQKMINMMYLVLTALLALNVSREVMDAFYEVMIGQEASIETIEDQNASLYAAFKRAADENEVKAGPWRDKALAVKAKSDNLYNSIETMKAELIERGGGEDEEVPGKPKKMDDREAAANYFLVEQHGSELKAAMADFRDYLVTEADENQSLVSALKNSFDLSDRMEDGAAESWEQSKFEQYPLISVMTFLTSMQSDIRTAEANVIGFLHENIDASDIKVTGVRAVVMPKSKFVTQGDEYEAEIFLAAFDDTKDPEFLINGEVLDPESVSGGVARIKFPATRTGTIEWNGKILLEANGETKEYEISESYNVAPPSVVISPTKMNVLYRGVDNPLEISVPGVDPANIVVNGRGVKKSGQNYTADVTRNSGGTMQISVGVRDAEGKVKSMGKKTFRVKNLPDANGTILGFSEGVRSGSFIKNNTINAEFKDFDFELDLKVLSFEIVIPPYAPIPCRGNRLTSDAKSALDKAKPGVSVVIRNIKATTAKGLKPSVNSMIFDLN